MPSQALPHSPHPRNPLPLPAVLSFLLVSEKPICPTYWQWVLDGVGVGWTRPLAPGRHFSGWRLVPREWPCLTLRKELLCQSKPFKLRP